MCPQNIKVHFFYIHFFNLNPSTSLVIFTEYLVSIPCITPFTHHLGKGFIWFFPTRPKKKKTPQGGPPEKPGKPWKWWYFFNRPKKNLRGAIVALQVLVSQSQLFNNDKPWLLPRQPARQESSNGVFSTLCEIRKLLGGGEHGFLMEFFCWEGRKVEDSFCWSLVGFLKFFGGNCSAGDSSWCCSDWGKQYVGWVSWSEQLSNVEHQW